MSELEIIMAAQLKEFDDGRPAVALTNDAGLKRLIEIGNSKPKPTPALIKLMKGSNS